MGGFQTLPTISVGRPRPPTLLLSEHEPAPNVSESATATTVMTMERALTDFLAKLTESHQQDVTENHMPPHWVESQLELFVYRRAVADREWMILNCPHRGGKPASKFGEIVRAYIASHRAKDIVNIVGVGTSSSLSHGGIPLRPPERQRQVRLLTLLTEFLFHQQLIGFRTMRELKARLAGTVEPTSTRSDPMSPSPPPWASAAIVDGEKIIHQLSVLKAGGYWKYLSSSGARDVEMEHHSEVEDNNTGDHSCCNENDEKENSRPACGNLHNVGGGWGRRNVTIPSSSQYGPDDDDDEQFNDDDGDEDDAGRSAAASTFLAGCVLSGGSVHSINGFFVKKVTGDGWLCSRTVSQMDQTTAADSCATYLLRLPWKVAKLGHEGMSIRGIDLRQRRDNGALEPCNGAMMDVASNDCSPLVGTIHL
jgi:hypothetical protein